MVTSVSMGLYDVGDQTYGGKKPLKIASVTHPDHISLNQMWYKWRLTYIGGDEFKRIFLKPFSTRESAYAFTERRLMSYVPAFAKTGINEIRNSIYQRLTDITRVTTSKSYNESVEGKRGGVDRRGSTMEYFLGTEVLTELLVMGKVGIYVDNPDLKVENYAQSSQIKPYLYIYKAEQIRSWSHNEHGELLTVLLEDVNYKCDYDFGLPNGIINKYRFYWIGDDGFVRCQFYDDTGLPDGDEIKLGIRQIPLHILHISSSLMADIADYQIALMNMASSDVQFARLANHPMYMEKYNVHVDLMQASQQGFAADGITPVVSNSPVTSLSGNMNGRRFPQEVDFPQWLSPDTKSLTASMEKQANMREEIKTLLFLSLGNLQNTRQSADSKQQDVSQEENGLSYIGFELSLAENKICELWHAYENNSKSFTIKYPQTYDIKTTSERIAEATGYIPLMQLVPSLTYKKELSKMIAKTILSGRSSYELLETVNKEIDANKLVISADQLITQVENQLVSHELASSILGYPEGEYQKAADESADQAAAIIEAQRTPESDLDMPDDDKLENPAARGVPELSTNSKEDIKNDRNKRKPYKPRGRAKKPKSDVVN